jgi:hypothetical protein
MHIMTRYKLFRDFFKLFLKFIFKQSIFVKKIFTFYQFFRVIYFISGAAGSRMIASGSVYPDPAKSFGSDPIHNTAKNGNAGAYLLVVNIAVLALPRLVRGLEAGRGTRGNTLRSNTTG